MIEIGNFSITPEILFALFFAPVLLTIIITFVLPGALGLKKSIEGIYVGRLIREAAWFKRYRLYIGIVAVILVVVSVGSYIYYLQGRPQLIPLSLLGPPPRMVPQVRRNYLSTIPATYTDLRKKIYWVQEILSALNYHHNPRK